MHILQLPIGLLASNCYLIYNAEGEEAAIVDPGMLDTGPLLQEITKRTLRIRYILNTHGHFDHVAGNGLLAPAEAGLGIHPADRDLLLQGGGSAHFGLTIPPSPEADLDLIDGASLKLGTATLEIIHTPGHTPGCVCLYLPDEAALLTGDTLFAGSVGRTDLPGGDQRKLENSLARLLQLPARTKIYPGHGPATTLDVEKRRNPWLKVLTPSRNETSHR
jgi:hydroxyacylglutathione hydrolase